MPQNARADDPLIELGTRWEALRREAGSAQLDAEADAASDRLHEVEQQMIPLVATTLEGGMAQIRVLRDLVPDDYGLLVENVLAALQLLLP